MCYYPYTSTPSIISVPSHLRTSPHLQTRRPIYQLFAPSADMPSLLPTGPSADGTAHLPTGPSGYTLPNLQTGCQQMGHPICQHFAQSADILSNLPTFCPICIQDKMFPDGPSFLPTGPSTDGTKCWQMGRPICQRACLQPGRVARWAGTYAPGVCLSIATQYMTHQHPQKRLGSRRIVYTTNKRQLEQAAKTTGAFTYNEQHYFWIWYYFYVLCCVAGIFKKFNMVISESVVQVSI